jgi:hypothetical protein
LRDGSTSANSAPLGSPSNPYVRTCETRAWGELGADHREHSIVVGPLVFLYLKDFATARPEDYTGPDGRLDPMLKVAVLVEAGAAVNVTVAPAAPEQAILLYRWSDGSAPAAESFDGDQSVTFQACTDADTIFTGGFRVSGPSCVPLDVRVADMGEPQRMMAAFFNKDCRS